MTVLGVRADESGDSNQLTQMGSNVSLIYLLPLGYAEQVAGGRPSPDQIVPTEYIDLRPGYDLATGLWTPIVSERSDGTADCAISRDTYCFV